MIKKRAGSASWPGNEPGAPQRCRAGAAPLAADSQRATLTGIVVEAAAAAAGHDRDSPRPLRHSVSGSAPDFGSGSCPGSSPGAGTRSSVFPYISALPAGSTRVHRPRHPGQLGPETKATTAASQMVRCSPLRAYGIHAVIRKNSSSNSCTTYALVGYGYVSVKATTARRRLT